MSIDLNRSLLFITRFAVSLLNTQAFLLCVVEATFFAQRLFSLQGFFGLSSMAAALSDIVLFRILGSLVVLMHVYLAFLMYALLVRRWPIKELVRYSRYAIALAFLTVVYTLYVTVHILLSTTRQRGVLRSHMVMFLFFWCLVFYFYIHSLSVLRAKALQSTGSLPIAMAVAKRLTVACFFFLAMVGGVLVMEAYFVATGSRVFTTHPGIYYFIESLWGCQGFVDAVIFGECFDCFAAKGPPANSHDQNATEYSNLIDRNYEVKIFASTFNMGSGKKAPNSAELEVWLRPGFDIYAIGVRNLLSHLNLKH